jgi:hypothetical protein
MVLGWGIGRALSFRRATRRWTFLSGVGLGAGLMYLLGAASRAGAQRHERSRGPVGRRPGASPARPVARRRPAAAKPKSRG